jgi:peptidyl-dipeptidase Dcp
MLPAKERANPLLVVSSLPFQAPAFDTISDSHFAPAFDQAMTAHMAEVERIASDPAAPTFENTLAALERSGQALTRVSLIFNALTSGNTNDTLQKLEEDVAPKLAAHQDAISLNRALFARIDTLYNERDQLRLDPEARRLLDVQHQQFVMAGALLSDADQARLKQLNEEDASLSAKFSNQLRAAAKEGGLVIADKAELAGLSPADIDVAAEAARERGLDGKWLISLSNTTQQPRLELLENRTVRERLFRASWTRAEHRDANDTRAIVRRLAEIRAEKAKLLGQPSFAAWRLQDQMARTPERVREFLAALIDPAIQKAKAEARDIQGVIDQQQGGFTLEPWDWNFYGEQVRKAQYDVDHEEMTPYFELFRVLEDGVFFAARELYGISFTERHDLPVYHPDVRVFEVFDVDGSHIALLYFDFFKRDNKNGGAWMDLLALQSRLLGSHPIITNVANFAKPSHGQPALISFDDVITMFHEFGHTLHGLFASQEYPTLSGTAVSRDFVELPSQFNEHWALEPRVFANYARHHATGEPMPTPLVEKVKRAAKFNLGYSLTEILAAVSLDLAWHTLQLGTAPPDTDAFDVEALRRSHLDLPQVPPRYRSSYFLHIWANGYAAGYYAYLWAEMLDFDAYDWFMEHGGMTRENGDRFRRLILSRGNSADYLTMFRDFRGRDPDIRPLLVEKGLTAASSS